MVQGHQHNWPTLDKKFLKGDNIIEEDLDLICPDGEVQIQEAQGHSIWVNSNILKKHGITDEIKDPAPGLSFYVRILVSKTRNKCNK